MYAFPLRPYPTYAVQSIFRKNRRTIRQTLQHLATSDMYKLVTVLVVAELSVHPSSFNLRVHPIGPFIVSRTFSEGKPLTFLTHNTGT